MNYLSVCSGIEAASVAWHGLGWSPVAFSEIEAFPSAVLKHRFPDTPNWGDMTKFEEWPDECVCDSRDIDRQGLPCGTARKRDRLDGRDVHADQGGPTRRSNSTCTTCGGLNAPIDLICGGTPCQSFSVAGLRKGLDDERGNLMLTFGHILAKYRPRWFVWENVPGVLSSNAGRDFASFLGLVTGQAIEPPADGWRNSGAISGIESAYDIAYRVLDAQYTRSPNYPRAVPQRRRRVFVVGHLGDWRRAAAVLLDSEGVSRNPPPSRKARERTPADAESGVGVGSHWDGMNAHPTLTQALGSSGGIAMSDQELFSQRGAGLVSTADVRLYDGVSVTSVVNRQNPQQDAPAFTLHSGIAHSLLTVYENHPQDSRINGPLDVNPTVDARCGTGGGNVPLVANWPVEVAPTLNAHFGDKQGLEDQHALNGAGLFVPVAFNCKDSGQDANDDVGLTLALRQREGKDGGGKGPLIFDEHSGTLATANDQTILHKTAVRRLLPLECERLQGFPDGWTDIPYRGNPNSPDGQRYKAIGNSMATNVMEWIGRRIQMVDEI